MSIWMMLHTLVIWPIRAIVEILFVVFQVVFDYKPGISIVFISLIINTILLPIYKVADRWQQEDRQIRDRMKKKLADIKAVFKGDERQMMVNTYYRQMGYSPFNALKASTGLLLQIPFFIGAYEFLSHTKSLQGYSFLFLANLGEPDGLLGFNLLPIIMTIINILSSLVYTRGAPLRERMQLIVMAGIFLVLLYNSPSGLVLYWTLNNLFSLGKNLANRYLKKPILALYWTITLFSLIVAIGLLVGLASLKPYYRYTLVAFFLAVPFIPLLWSRIMDFIDRSIQNVPLDRGLYYGSWLILFVLIGLFIPAQTIASSPTEFENPWSFILRTALQGFSACILLPGFIWSFSDSRHKRVLSVLSAFSAILALISFFILSGNYGTMTRGFVFDNPHLLKTNFPLWVTILAVVITIVLCIFLLNYKKLRFFKIFLGAASIAVLLSTSVELFAMNQDLHEVSQTTSSIKTNQETIFHIARDKNNTFIIFLDRAIGVAFNHALALLPDTISEFEGFVWYPKTISFGDCTILGVPSIFGGYDYTPWNINKRTEKPLVDKINESLTLLPRLYSDLGWRVAITDPSLAGLKWVPDISIFNGIPNVTARNIKGLYAKRFLEEHAYPPEPITETFDYDILFRFSLFRVVPPALRYMIYYNGGWWRDGRSNSFERSLAVFPNLYYLKDLCAIDNGPPSLNIFMNESTHEYGAFTTDYMPSRDPVLYGKADLERFGSQGDAAYAYAFLASIRALGNWIRYLKAEGVYDNSLIIIVADHGGRFHNTLFEIPSLERYNPLFLVKERGARGTLRMSDEFMTIAEVPFILSKIDPIDSKNPFTGNNLHRYTHEPLRIYEAPGSQNRHGPIGFTLTSSRAYLGGDIYSARSWGNIEK
ncbi:YidC/Oxa1 family membrane protein insertase [Gracilinema caldarium]|uniref:Membrane protein insertase, YidC/Oxa1 family n=1 Tax=Gracilinema caldarium (strain ATCC 51460 / DSM 7334 / H1) TaxID=744872 RepID=F8F0X5_GRAC1|nr:YidC/Oxa1 family membrane protein insertase [Gracilinema caldarium]AEJ20261.1 membrane protein insertase, YidC/Oxa1 family [Gracilinema caldarium DSM 7334]